MSRKRRILKVVIIGIPVVLLASAAFVLATSWFDHRRLVEEETAAYPAPGSLVAVDDARLHVYAEGDGDPTLVFLSGLGTSSPYYEFKELFERM